MIQSRKPQHQPRSRQGCEGSGKRRRLGEENHGTCGEGGGWLEQAGLGPAGVLLKPAGAEAVYLVSH